MKLNDISRPSRTRVTWWMDQLGIKNYTIKPDGVVDVDGDVILSNRVVSSIPVQFGRVNGHFYCHKTKITTLDGAPRFVNGYFDCSNTKIRTLHGINKIIDRINGMFICDNDVTHILGLILIKGITRVNIDGPIDYIIDKYVGTGDILSCQDELIDAGYKAQARL